jgi:hypothetical protein
MIEKDNNVHDIEEVIYRTNFFVCVEILQKWYARKKTPEMKALFNAFTDISAYVMQMQKRQREYDRQISEWRAAKNRAVLRARKLEEKIENDKTVK